MADCKRSGSDSRARRYFGWRVRTLVGRSAARLKGYASGFVPKGKGGAHLRRGRRGEARAALYFRLRGWRITARNWRSHFGEVDLIVYRRGVFAFVEVKTRPRRTEDRAVVGAKQRRRLERAALDFCEHRLAGREYAMRFDVMEMTGPLLRANHIADAWRPGDEQ